MTPKLTKVIRLDNLPLDQTYYTEEGYLKDRPILTRTGIFEYAKPDGTVSRELRLPEDVFAPESLSSYKGKPIIVTHDAGLVNKDNVHEEQIGTILTEGYRSGENVRAEIIIHDTDELKKCGLRELSLGYNLDLEETPGEWNGQPYDAIQRNIRINHLALVQEARAGETARLNIDSRDSKKSPKGGKKVMRATKKNTAKKTRRADGVLNPEQLSAAIEAYKAMRAARLAAKADEDAPAAEEVAKAEETTVDNDTVAENATVEEKVEMVKDRRDRRDEEGDPETVEEAQGVIANQDEDIDVLFDIIDTLLAEKAFDETENPATEGEESNDEGEDVAEGEETNADEGEETEEEEVAADEDEELVEGEETEEVAEDEDEEETTDPAATGTVNADSVDKIVRQRIKLGMIGRTLNLDGLEDMSPSKAKKAVIRAVRPGIRLDGKSPAYIQAMFDLAYEEVKANSKKGTTYQKKQMFNSDGRTAKKASGASAARQRMIDRQHKVKEDK